MLSERVGVVNVAIEGQLLAGAFSSAIVASLVLLSINAWVMTLVGGVPKPRDRRPRRSQA